MTAATDLDTLRQSVDAATTNLIAAHADLEAAQAVEYEAVNKRTAAEHSRQRALAQLTEARAALDARIGIAPPAPASVTRTLDLAAARLAVGPYHDDDDPVR